MTSKEIDSGAATNYFETAFSLAPYRNRNDEHHCQPGKSLSSLEKIVDELESGELPLEKAMKKFEEGIKLTRSCQTALRQAEQKVEILMRDAGGDAGNDRLEEFDDEEA